MNLFKSNYFERAFAGNGLLSIIYYLRKLVNGFDANTLTSNGGGIDGVNTRLDAVKTKLDTLDVSVKLDDTDIHNIYTLLDDRLVKKLWITRADYDQLVLDNEVDPEILYIVIESQSNPNP